MLLFIRITDSRKCNIRMTAKKKREELHGQRRMTSKLFTKLDSGNTFLTLTN